MRDLQSVIKRSDVPSRREVIESEVIDRRMFTRAGDFSLDKISPEKNRSRGKNRLFEKQKKRRTRVVPDFVKEMQSPSRDRTRDRMMTSEIREIKKNIEEKASAPLTINIMVTGPRGVGKTAFIKMFLNYVSSL